jgi:hypothetical protein
MQGRWEKQLITPWASRVSVMNHHAEWPLSSSVVWHWSGFPLCRKPRSNFQRRALKSIAAALAQYAADQWISYFSEALCSWMKKRILRTPGGADKVSAGTNWNAPMTVGLLGGKWWQAQARPLHDGWGGYLRRRIFNWLNEKWGELNANIWMLRCVRVNIRTHRTGKERMKLQIRGSLWVSRQQCENYAISARG